MATRRIAIKLMKITADFRLSSGTELMGLLRVQVLCYKNIGMVGSLTGRSSSGSVSQDCLS